ncbi:MAG: cation diffusion facilitator family transporter [Alphaproteobacteria bacterium]|uniref:Cation diffusion facilitator family transporter n=1 Tax=Candidatus Nitrobium versatile TaxID=2884831 RepID=A0A953M1F8_9BACT|nr:cation diffusion facilitator family transporter [Candidatus Nitrobium versatile]
MGNSRHGTSDALAYEGKKTAIMSSGLNTVLTAIKFLLYYLTGSAALFAEAVHSLTDVAGSLLVVGGIYLSGRKSKQFPWGLYKAENIAALFSAGLILFSAYGIAAMIYRPVSEGVRNLDLSLLVLLLMSFPIMLFARYEKKKARELNSPSLSADAENWKMDLAPLAVVIVGIAGAQLSFPVMDRIAASLVLLLVVKAGYGLFKDSVRSLLDVSVDEATLGAIRDTIKAFPEVKAIIALQAWNSGRFIFIETAITLSLKRLKDAHEIADDMERNIKNLVPFVGKVTIHYEPEKKNHTRYAVPLADRDGAISEHFAKAPFIGLWDKRPDGTISTRQTLENPFAGLEKGKGIKLAELITEQGVDILYTKELLEGKGPEYVLSGAEVEVRKTDLKTLHELIELSHE